MTCMLLGFQYMPKSFVMDGVRQVINHGLECDGVVSEEPDVFNPAEVRQM